MQRKKRASNSSQSLMTSDDQFSPLIIDSKVNNVENDNIELGVDNYSNGKAVDLKIPAIDSPKEILVASVVRSKCGTSPFDEHWLNKDCCGLFCAGLTYLLHLYGIHAVCNVLIPPWMSYKTEDGVRHLSLLGYLNSLGFIYIALMAIISHFKAMTTNPGAVPPDATPIPDPSDIEQKETNDAADSPPKFPQRPHRVCRRCNTFKPPRAHHCSVCKRCITKMDHHCPWVNNCVGIGNHKFFLLFVFYTFLSCMYSLFLLILRLMVCSRNDADLCLDDPSQLISLIGLTIESLLFGLFTSCMMVDQWDVVTTNLTHIDRLKGETFFMEQYQERMNKKGPRVNEVFGIGKTGRLLMANAANFRSDWLSPFVRVVFPDSIHDEIMGFCRPCCGPMQSNSRKDDDDFELSSSQQERNKIVDIV